jgi:hypothetical protein
MTPENNTRCQTCNHSEMQHQVGDCDHYYLVCSTCWEFVAVSGVGASGTATPIGVAGAAKGGSRS